MPDRLISKIEMLPYNVIVLWGRYEPDRTLYLAVSEDVRKSVFEEEAGQVLIEDRIVRVLTFDVNREEIIKWIP